MQKIEIKHLGPIKQLEMDIKDFNLLIGEQATGKSTVAKAIYFFRIIKTTLIDYLCQIFDTALYNGNKINKNFEKDLKKELKSVFISLFGYSWDLDENLDLKYEYTKNIWIEVKLNKNKDRRYINVGYSKDLKQEINKLQKEALALYENKLSSTKDTTSISLVYASKERLRNYDSFKKKINSIFDDYKETYYIPAGRSMITLLANNRSLIENENLDLITRQFIQIIDNINETFSDGIKDVYKRYSDGEKNSNFEKIAEILISNLKGDYQYTAGKGYIIVKDSVSSNERIPINFASSGQQEVLWLLNQLYVLMLKKEKSFIIIEEPEAHIYPNLQNKVIEFIAQFANINDSSIMITTHSPYILTTVNVLYCAGKIIRDFPNLTETVHTILESKCEIVPEKITAFKISKNKSIQNLIDNEFDEINAEIIDEVSDSVNKKYMNLFYLTDKEEM